MEISKNSKFYISPEEMATNFKDRRNVNILCFNRLMNLMVAYPNRTGRTYMNYYFNVIFKDVASTNDGLLLCTYKFGFKNKNGDIIVKNFCFTDKDEEYLALERAIAWYATSPDSQLDNKFYKITIKDETGNGSTYNISSMKIVEREEYINQVSEVYHALEREKGFWGV